MPSSILPAYALTVNGGTPSRVTYNVQVTNPRVDRVTYALSITRLMADAWGASHPVRAAAIEIDRGSGLELIGADELGAEVSISGSYDSYGRTASFFLRCESPLLDDLTRRMARVRITGYQGKPGYVGSKVIFDGFIQSARWVSYPKGAAIQCQDTSIRYAEILLEYDLAPGDIRTRKQVITDICTIYEIASGDWDLPNDGGVVFKGIAAGGDVRLIDWMRDFLAPIGRRPRFVGGKLYIVRADGVGSVQRVLTSADFTLDSPPEIEPPATSEANSVTVSSTVYGFIGPSGLRTVVERQTTRGVYAPRVAVNKQDHLTGAITATGLTTAAADRIVSHVVTQTTFDGDTMVSQVIFEYGWRANRAHNRRITSGGVETYNDKFTVYQYDDDLWYSSPQESFQLVRMTVTQRTFDSVTGILAQEDTARFGWRGVPFGVSHFDPTNGNEIRRDVVVDENGEAWLGGCESWLPIVTRSIFTPTADGRVASIATTKFLHGAYATGTLGFLSDDGRSGIPSPANTIETAKRAIHHTAATLGDPPHSFSPDVGFLFVKFGPTGSPRYGLTTTPFSGYPFFVPEYPLFGLGTDLVETYTQVSESEYRIETSAGRGYASWVGFANLESTQFTPSRVITGAIPRLPEIASRTTAQAATLTVTDGLRENMTTPIRARVQNDLCETIEEMRTVALEQLRELSAIRINGGIPLDLLLEEGQVVEIDVPEFTGPDPLRCIVWSNDLTLNMRTGEARHSVGLRHIPYPLAA
ncbi:MAG TPA: hypothetical protein VNL91_04190 [Thermoanaerobaculia bacterium]|nr:hypothetical protein [Thermoanaerobaculia bacterium]